MIDETLARLSRDLIAASDKLDSEDFKQRQARFIALEAERAQLAESLEADEAAVVAAQEALQAHFTQGNSGLPDSLTVLCLPNTKAFSEGDIWTAPNGDSYMLWDGKWVKGNSDFPHDSGYVERSDEFSDARAPYTNGTGD